MSDAGHVAERDEVVAAIDTQIGWCLALDAPFTGSLLGVVRDNIANDGALAALVVPWAGKPLADALPIRLAGAFHALVRAGRAPDLAAVYPASRCRSPARSVRTTSRRSRPRPEPGWASRVCRTSSSVPISGAACCAACCRVLPCGGSTSSPYTANAVTCRRGRARCSTS